MLKLTLVAEGLQFPEGPIWMLDGSIVLVEIRAGRLSRVTPNGVRTTVAELGGGPNGAAIGPDGAVYVCNNGGMSFVDLPGGGCVPHGVPDDYVTGSIQRVDPATGAATTLYDACDGKRLRGPNDIVFDAHGGFWFTDLGKVYDHGQDAGGVLLRQGGRLADPRGAARNALAKRDRGIAGRERGLRRRNADEPCMASQDK